MITNKKNISTVDHFINGEDCPPDSGQYFDDRNPIDDSVYARAAQGNGKDMDKAAKAAHEAFATYRHSLINEREAWLCEAASILQRQKQEFIDILIDEVGSPVGKANFEVGLSIDLLRAAAGMARQVAGKTLPSDVPGRFSMSTREPIGVVAAITPFNVPLIKGIRLTANPLALGNTVVHLCSEEAPVLARRIARLYQDAGLPPGAYNLVTGLGFEVGDSLTTHPLVRSVTFTGSTRVGRHIQKLCAEHSKRITLELGGKNPMVVLKDADLDKAVEGAIHGIFIFQGQICMAASRMYVERAVFDEFIEKFSGAAQGLGMGDLREPSTLLGPIISERQRERIRYHIRDAVEKGATLVCGGEWEANRCKPTILTDVTPSMTVCKEETFGPVTSVYPIDSFEEALDLANDSNYGLSASIYTSNIDNAMSFARNVESGMVHINGATLQDEPHVPFGGVGDSGWGREGTEEDIAAMTEYKWITVQL
ncbi:MAG: aldehyde dehydrogenase family protein [Gammaproteobacteria bacterium]|nr:aldehyde dehydrogenase family protein [Gammaproteobacteria bacterium]